MIYLKMYGRLGNQMFQYAFCRAIQEQFYPGERICVSFEKVYELGAGNQLKDFNIQAIEEMRRFKMKFPQFCVRLFCEMIRRSAYILFRQEIKRLRLEGLSWKIGNRFGIYCNAKSYYFIESQKGFTKDKYCIGLYEAEEYFTYVEDIIRQEFIPKHPLLAKNTAFYERIRNRESICVTIRRGDFLDDAYREIHHVCSIEYFLKGIEIIRLKRPNTKLFVFSDDMEWVKKNIDFQMECEYETGEDPVWEKLRLMSACKHFVISNSTFSWWAQYLSDYEDKIVVAPYPWKHKENHSAIYQKNFILLDVESLRVIN